MSFRKLLLGLLTLGLGLAAAMLGGLCLACFGLARLALRGAKQKPVAQLPNPPKVTILTPGPRPRPVCDGTEGPLVVIKRPHR